MNCHPYQHPLMNIYGMFVRECPRCGGKYWVSGEQAKKEWEAEELFQELK